MTAAFSSSVFLLLLLLPNFISGQLAQQQPLQTKSFTFEYFNKTNKNNFIFNGDSDISQEALQLTPDTENDKSFKQNKSGQVIFPRRFKLWRDNGNSSINLVASFNTSFVINIFHSANDAGEGLSFAILPSKDSTQLPNNSYGGFLGLTNSTIDGLSDNQFVAVEFDTFKQVYDPDDNHVGLNINSVKSKTNTSLTNNTDGYNLILSPTDVTAFFTVWIDYDGPKREIKVYMANHSERALPVQTVAKPAKPVLTSELDLSKNLSQHSYFGFSGSTGDSYQLNCVLKWNLTVEIIPENPGTDVKGWLLKACLPILVVLISILAAIIGFYVRASRKKVRSEERLGFALKTLPGMPKEYAFKDLKVATCNFDDRNRLGKGGFGAVYGGKLPGEGTVVAVKTFLRDSSQGDFLSELTIINRLRHRNLVPLLGWCYKNNNLLLVYELMPNGSLDKHLFNTETPLTWERRYNTVVGVSSALHYLHNEYDNTVIHRDLKASNIMLDSGFNARLGDFGLARAIDNEKTSYTEQGHGGMPGTVGYIAPECFHTQKATRESDVYGFGGVVLEVVCGRKPVLVPELDGFRLLVDWVWMLYREGRILEAVDQRLLGRGGESGYVEEEAERLLRLGLGCSHPMADERPKMHDIVQIVNKLMSVPDVPRFKPAFFWPGSGPVSLNFSSYSSGGGATNNMYSSSNGSSSVNNTCGR